MAGLERRVGIFAALAEPTRLQIVDLLTLGDLSSSEIGATLAISSNLVAHHLRVLESAGIIARTRSEFDKRRNYIGLLADVFETLAPASVTPPQRLLFVCTANSARSQLAEAIWRGVSPIPVVSAGMRPAASVHPGAVASAARHGLRIDIRRRPQHVDDVYTDGDLVISVCDDAHERLGMRDDIHWSIPDPATSGTAVAFDAALEEIRRRIGGFTARLADAA